MRIDILGPTAVKDGEQAYINFLWGKPNPSLLPVRQMAAAAQSVFSETSLAVLALEPGEFQGHKPLRVALASWLNGFYNGSTNTDNLCITGGASTSLDTILKVFTDPLLTEAVWMTEPGYFAACRMFEDAGLTNKLRVLAEDDDGILDLDLLEQEIVRSEDRQGLSLQNGHSHDRHIPGNPEVQRVKPEDPLRKTYSHIIYVVPTFSNPSSRVMSLECRQRLVKIARDHNALVISDDIYDFLQWQTDTEGTPTSKAVRMPRLVDIERTLPQLGSDPNRFGHTLSNGSFSKIAAPGLRCGWVDASPIMALALSDAGSTRSGGCPASMVAPIITELFKDGFLEKHVHETLVPAYQKRRRIMTQVVEEYLEPLGVTWYKTSRSDNVTVGGYFLWLRLPAGLQSTTVAKKAREEENLVVPPGTAFAVTGKHDLSRLDQHLRLCFAWSEEQDLVEGVRRLSRVIQRLQGTLDSKS